MLWEGTTLPMLSSKGHCVRYSAPRPISNSRCMALKLGCKQHYRRTTFPPTLPYRCIMRPM